jgi:hypothetical protein
VKEIFGVAPPIALTPETRIGLLNQPALAEIINHSDYC